MSKREDLIKEVKKYFKDVLCVEQEHNYNKNNWDSKKGKAFEEWLVKEVFGPTLGITSSDDLEESYDHGSFGEKTCDIVIQPNENELHIFECKFTEKKNSIEKEWISEVCSIANWIDDLKTIEKLPDFAKDKIKDFDLYSDSSSITVYLVTAHHLNDNDKADWDTAVKQTIKKSKIKNLQFKFFTHNNVFDEWGRAQGNQEPTYSNIKLEDLHDKQNRVTSLELHSPNNIPMYNVIVRGTEVVNWVNTNKAIFHENIRGYRGQNQVNRELITTIANEPENFLIYNNGITATSSNIVKDDVFLNCDRFQIINGCQTASTLKEFSSSTKKLDDGTILSDQEKQEILKKLRVQVRILDVGKGDKNRIIKDKLIKANNTQTPITASDFRSTDSVQVHIENTINNNKNKNYFYRGGEKPKKLFYKRKVGALNKKLTNTLIIKLTDLTESVFAFEQNPYELSANKKLLYDDEIGSRYWKIFGLKGTKAESLNTDRIETMVGEHLIWTYLKTTIDNIIKDDGIKKEDAEYEYFYPKRHYFSIFAHLLRQFEMDDKAIKKSLNGELYDEKNIKPFKEIIWEIQEHIKKPFDYARHQNETLILRNWMRTSAKFESLIEDIKSLNSIRKLKQHFEKIF